MFVNYNKNMTRLQYTFVNVYFVQSIGVQLNLSTSNTSANEIRERVYN